ncbi:MAG TPA: hypothetical protein VFZ53_05390 [Polyangiaceae bacterium]
MNDSAFPKSLVASLLLAGLVACRAEKPRDTIELVVPDGSGRTVELAPRSAFAEYVEVPESANELRVTLASYDVSCERYVAPGADDTVLVVTLKLPPGEKPRPGSFASTRPLSEDGGSPLGRAYAVPVIRRGARGHALPPGGTLELELVEFGRSGVVKGAVAFEFPGDGTRPASSAKGKFSARLCRHDEAPITR